MNNHEVFSNGARSMAFVIRQRVKGAKDLPPHSKRVIVKLITEEMSRIKHLERFAIEQDVSM